MAQKKKDIDKVVESVLQGKKILREKVELQDGEWLDKVPGYKKLEKETRDWAEGEKKIAGGITIRYEWNSDDSLSFFFSMPTFGHDAYDTYGFMYNPDGNKIAKTFRTMADAVEKLHNDFKSWFKKADAQVSKWAEDYYKDWGESKSMMKARIWQELSVD